ncbi:MAG: DUF2442 domain-containing protein [Pirellulales bacterium]
MKVASVKPLSQFRVELVFDDGLKGIVDLSSIVGRGVFAAWNEPGCFERVSVTEDGALQWPGELDLCPDALYLQLTGKKAEEVFPAIHDRLSHA